MKKDVNAVTLGKRGGAATKRKMPKDFYKEIGSLGGKKKRDNRIKAK